MQDAANEHHTAESMESISLSKFGAVRGTRFRKESVRLTSLPVDKMITS